VLAEGVDVQEWLGTAVTADSSGRPDVNMEGLNGSTNAATVLADWMNEGKGQGAADSGTTTTLVDSALTQADDFWNGALLVFRTGRGVQWRSLASGVDRYGE